MRLRCSGRSAEGQNCVNSIEISGPVSASARYTCKDHAAEDTNEVHFQLYQFDDSIGSGTDPRAYERRRVSKKSSGKFPRIGRPRKKRLAETEKLLTGHANAAKIMHVLKTEIRDGNS